MKKRLYLLAVLLLAIAAAFISVWAPGGPMRLPIYIRIGESVGFTETTFAPKYDEQIFRGIQDGMTSNTVTMKLGKPLWARDVGKQYDSTSTKKFEWGYSFDGPRDTHYYERFIYFDDEHRVVEKRKGIYWD